ncbi:hypothetical protein DSO57_1034499 [Entomophthora muscae]|uniref:Uncharacterized protein n=1 Tax=Entomophthora muscae TaxID=34485 RepID=A0ACC2SNT8_9FUNG|nr:hypothetical protein DSO57_1034499 [Entomophthora muscae]
MILGPIVLGLRCDRCFTKHLKCNRAFPTCDQCSKQPGTPCTFDRKARRKAQAKQFVQRNVACATKIHLPRHIVSFGLEGAKPLRTFLNITMTFFMFPSMTLPMLYVSIARRYQSHVQTLKRAEKIERSEPITRSFIMLLNKAEDAYFDNVNDFIGLFPRPLFNIGPRSSLLRAAILSCGLLWCENDSSVEKAQAHLTSFLGQATMPSRLPLTLDSIQSLLVLMLGMFGNSWVTCRMEFFFTTAVRAAYAIGLHTPRKHKNRLELERQLTSNCLLYYLNFFITSNNPTHVHLSPLPSSMIPSSDLTFLFSCSLGVINNIFPDIVRLKFTLVENLDHIPAAEIERRIKDLENRLTGLCFDYMVKLNQLALVCHPSVPQLHTMANLFSFYHSYYAFIISSMRLYRTTTSLHPVPLSPPSIESINVAILLCMRAISWGLKIEKPHDAFVFCCKVFSTFDFHFTQPQIRFTSAVRSYGAGLTLPQVFTNHHLLWLCQV